MKTRRLLLGVALAIVLGSLSHANTALPDAAALGQAAAILSFCADVNLQNEPKYRDLARALTADSSAGDRHGVQDSPEYRAAFQSVRQALDGSPHAQAAQICASAVNLR